MSITLTPTQAALSGSDAVLVDHIGNEVYAAHYTERRLSRFVIGTLAVLLVGSFTMIHSLANRPLANRYVRIDEMGRAQAIQYSDLNYSPREGEVRTYLTDWANYRFTVNRETVAAKSTFMKALLGHIPMFPNPLSNNPTTQPRSRSAIFALQDAASCHARHAA